PIVRFASSSRSLRASRAARRWKMALSQYSTWAKNNRCAQTRRSVGVKKGDEAPEPLLAAAFQIGWRQRVGERLEPGRGAARQEHVPGLPKGDPFGLHPPGQPVVLVDAQPRGERKVRADADEHSAPFAVEEIEVVLVRPAPFELQ